MGLAGVEPATSPLSGVRSNQLSYRPKLYVGATDNGGAKEDRTPDLLRARQALSQLSYSPNMTIRLLYQLHLKTVHLETRNFVRFGFFGWRSVHRT